MAALSPTLSKQFLSTVRAGGAGGWDGARARRQTQLDPFFLQAADVGATDHVPGVDVLLHTTAQAGLFARGQRGPGGGHAVGETDLVHLADQVAGVKDVGLCGDGGGQAGFDVAGFGRCG